MSSPLTLFLAVQFLGTVSEHCDPEIEYLAPIGGLLVLLFGLIVFKVLCGAGESSEDHYKEEVENAQKKQDVERGEPTKVKHHRHHHSENDEKVHRHHHHQHHSA